MQPALGPMLAFVALLASGCFGPSFSQCHASDSTAIVLRADVPMEAIEGAFVDEGWSIPGVGDAWASKAWNRSTSLVADARPLSSSNGTGPDGPILVTLRSMDLTEAQWSHRTEVDIIEAALIERLRSLGEAEIPPGYATYTMGGGSDLECIHGD